ncbi:cytochrome c oxidase subunit II [Natrinema caseinilyticum]|uniref:cytochrome c oxidase subunit II n=1 Tax=Natrinema caseinilyticum TaxID=2961570 RepID=UPI0020C3564D|nr:cytochrome c oxidase subunit II [Natrinema caseinilyticum]
MRIHSYEKLWLAASMVLILGFIATITYGAVGLGIEMIGEEDETVAPNEIDDDERFGEPRVEQVGPDEYEVYVIAQTFSFRPNPIEIPANSKVTFHVTSRDVIHGFEVPGTNINSMAIPGQVAQLTVVFDEPGDYGLICTEYCGDFHHQMEGEIVVVPEDEFDMTELSVEAPDTVQPGDEVELNATVRNGQFEELETTVDAEIGNQTFQRDISVDGQSAENVSFSVDSDELGEGEYEWSVTVDNYEEDGSVTVAPNETGDEETGDEETGDD